MILKWTIIKTITSIYISIGLLYSENIIIAGACVDKDKSCSGWANSGECTNNPLWMLQNCPKSCQVCTAACVNIYNDQYCEMHFGNCWRQSTAPDLVKNCYKTCVCKCCPLTPVTLPTTATFSNTTTAINASTAHQTTAATILYSTTSTGKGKTTTLRPQTTNTSSGTEVKPSILPPTTRIINGTRQDLGATETNGLSTVLLSAIIAGVIAFIGVLGIVSLWLWRRKRSGSLNQQKWPPLPPVQDDCVPTEEIIWLERQPRRDSSKPMVVSLDANATNGFHNPVLTKDSPEIPVAEAIPRSPDTPLYHVLEGPDSTDTSREQALSVHYEQSSERLRSDSDYDEPVLNEVRSAIGSPSKARENEAVYEEANPKGFTDAASSSNTLDDEYCYSYTTPDQNQDGKNGPHEVPKTDGPFYHALEGPNAGYQAPERPHADGYTPMAGITESSGYQPLKKSTRSVYQPLKKTNEPLRRAFTRK
ncbi:hypothetical protein ACROYT_G032942 [Oculina patagonica]